MNNRPRFLSLRIKLALGFALVFMVASGVVSYSYYQNTRTQLREGIRERLHDAVAIGALQVDSLAHSQLTDPSQEGGPTYLRLKKTLQNIRDAGTDIRFVYTMRQDAQGSVVFIVDAEESEEDVSHLGDIYEDASDWLKSNFASMQEATVEDEMYTDKWGTWLTGYAPIYRADGTREAILGMDISASIVIAQETEAREWALLIFFGSVFLGIIAGLILGSILAGPVSKLTRAAENYAAGDFSHRVDVRTRDEVEILANSFNSTAEKMNSLITGLEQRVEERTEALSRRTSQLQAAIQVARQAAAIKDTASLLDDTVRLISDQFGFYHAGIFLLDENHEYAILQAASSTGGQRMLSRGHRLRIGSQGIVGFVAAQKSARIALDTGADAVYFDNPDLPGTRSEAALPLISRDHVIGVLDIQSEKPQAFTQEDIETFQALADQIALAIENARLFNEMGIVVDQLEQTFAHRVQDSWSKQALDQISAYQYTPLGIQPITRQVAPASDAGMVQIPISLHSRKIGEIRVKRKDEAGQLDPAEQSMLVEIAAQVALALENARLLDDAQRRAVRERTVSEITARIGSAYDIDTILRVTAHEIGKAIGDSEITVQIREAGLAGQT